MSGLIGWYRGDDGQMRAETGVFNPIDNTYTFTQKIEYYTDPIAASPMSITLMGNGEVFFNGQVMSAQSKPQRALDGIEGFEISKTQRMIEIRSLDLFRAVESSRTAAWDAHSDEDYRNPVPRVDRDIAILSVADFDAYHRPQWTDEQDDWDRLKQIVAAARVDGIDTIVVIW